MTRADLTRAAIERLLQGGTWARRDLFAPQAYQAWHSDVLRRLLDDELITRLGGPGSKLTVYVAAEPLHGVDLDSLVESTLPESARSPADPVEDATTAELLKSIVIWCNHLSEQIAAVEQQVASIHGIVREFVE